MSATRLFIYFIFVLAAARCASRGAVSEQYVDATSDRSGRAAKTSVLFLVDGLAVPILESALSSDRAPNLAKFFSIPSGQAVPLARASFPSLTYPNLTSILTAEPVALHGILGNRVLDKNLEVVNFENILAWDYLNDRIGHRLIFTRLSHIGENSVSYSYPFSKFVTAKQQKTLDVGVLYAKHDYASVDDLTLQSLEMLLQTPRESWPRFIFVHLIGIDGFAHRFGPASEEVKKYITELDSKMGRVLEELSSAEAVGFDVSTVLTADHGFATTENSIPIADIAQKLPPGMRVVPDNRMASVYLPQEWANDRRLAVAQELRRVSHVEWSVAKSQFSNQIELFHSSGRRARIDLKVSSTCRHGPWLARFEWIAGRIQSDELNPEFRCLEDYDADASFTNATYLVPALVEYFTAQNSPDLILIADSHSDFASGYKGNHGGLLPEEMLVPLLTRNFLGQSKKISPTWRLLRDLKFK